MLSEIISAVVGGLLSYGGSKFINRLQKMKCQLVSDDIQSKITVSIDGVSYNNVYFKEFLLTNTTNRDLDKFKVVFSFDETASVIECHSKSKEGNDWLSMVVDNNNSNKVIADVSSFNRGDKITFYIRVGNVTNNMTEITESDCTGFKIKKIEY